MICIRRGFSTHLVAETKVPHVLGSVLDVWDTAVNEQDSKTPFITYI